MTPKPPRDGWQMPPKPATAHECQHGGTVIPEAYIKDCLMGRGWVLLWSCSECNAEFDAIEWPFGDEGATNLDLEAAGFTVTEEWGPSAAQSEAQP